MGSAFYIVVEQENPAFATLVNGKALAKESDSLDGVAARAGITPLLSFFSPLPEAKP